MTRSHAVEAVGLPIADWKPPGQRKALQSAIRNPQSAIGSPTTASNSPSTYTAQWRVWRYWRISIMTPILPFWRGLSDYPISYMSFLASWFRLWSHLRRFRSNRGAAGGALSMRAHVKGTSKICPSMDLPAFLGLLLVHPLAAASSRPRYPCCLSNGYASSDMRILPMIPSQKMILSSS